MIFLVADNNGCGECGYGGIKRAFSTREDAVKYIKAAGYKHQFHVLIIEIGIDDGSEGSCFGHGDSLSSVEFHQEEP